MALEKKAMGISSLALANSFNIPSRNQLFFAFYVHENKHGWQGR